MTRPNKLWGVEQKMHNQSEKLKLALPIIIGFVVIILLTFYVPDIWTSNRNYRASQKPRATEKMARFRSCLIEAGFIEGMPDGDFTLDPVHEMVDGVKPSKLSSTVSLTGF